MFEKVLCDDCVHCSVCKHSDEYKAANEAVKETTVHFGDNRMIRLRDIPWIKYGLSCDYYFEDHKTRTLAITPSITGAALTGTAIKSSVRLNEVNND